MWNVFVSQSSLAPEMWGMGLVHFEPDILHCYDDCDHSTGNLKSSGKKKLKKHKHKHQRTPVMGFPGTCDAYYIFTHKCYKQVL